MPRGRRGAEAEEAPEGSASGSGTTRNIGRDRSGRERRKVRRGLRNLISSLQDNRSELITSQSDGLQIALNKASRIYKHVSDTRETALDAEFLSLASRLGVEKASKIKTSLKESYDPHQFVANLKRFVKGVSAAAAESESDEELEATQTQATQATQRRGVARGDFNWHALGARVQHLFKATPRVDFMYGPLNAEPPARKERKQRVRDAVAEQKVAEEGIDHDNQIGRMTSARVEEVRALVHKNPGKNLKKLLVNPSSYGQTVENFFHFAFLVKDGFVKQQPDSQDEGTVVQPAEQPSKEDYAQGVAERKQCIMRLDYATFQRLSEEVSQPMLKTQDYSNIEKLVAKRKAIIQAANQRHQEQEEARQRLEAAKKAAEAQAQAEPMDEDDDDDDDE